MTLAEGTSLSSLLDTYSPTVQETFRAARELILQSLPGAIEVVDSKARVVGYGYGTSYRDTIYTLILSKGGVKLGLVGSASLADPHRLMEGKGKVHRYISLASPGDLDRKGLSQLMRAALSAWRERRGA
jgi:hypothetical protein